MPGERPRARPAAALEIVAVALVHGSEVTLLGGARKALDARTRWNRGGRPRGAGVGRTTRGSGVGEEELITVEVFDLGTDPRETRNLAAAGCSGDCASLKIKLEQRVRALGPPRGTRRGTFTAEESEEPRALGYL